MTGVQPSAGRRTRVMAAVVVASTSGVIAIFLVGAVAVQLQAGIGISEAGVGAGAAVFFAGSALMSAFAARLMQFRFGPSVGLRAGLTISAAVSLAIAAFVDSPALLFVLLGAGGLSNAITQPSANQLVADSFAPRRMGVAFAVKQSAVVFGAFFGGLAVPLIAIPFGWRWCFVAAAGVAVCGLLLVPRSAESLSRPEQADPARRHVTAPLVLLTVAAAFAALVAGALATFLVLAAVDAGFSDAQAGLLFALGSFLIIASRLAAGFWVDRGVRQPLRIAAGMLLVGVVGCLMLAAGAGGDRIGIFLAGALVAFALGWGWPGVFNYSVVRYHSDIPGFATGVTQTGIYLGAILGPLAVGFLAESFGFAVAWLFVAAAGLVAAIVVEVANRRLRDSDGVAFSSG